MGWIIGLGVIYLLMAVCKSLFGNPLVIFGLIYVGGCVFVLGSIVIRMLGGSM